MDKTLLILAAWMGSRYGWLKQLDWFGENGEAILEYSIYDAIRAWFTKVVFIIRETFEEEFKAKFADTFQDKIKVEYVFQDMMVNIDGKEYGAEREKPWGTSHAVLCAKDAIDWPFAVINADDYYGVWSYGQAIEYFDNKLSADKCAMIGYVLNNTLSDHGTVNRWICKVMDNGCLDTVEEHIGIWYVDWDHNKVEDENTKELWLKDIVSMNFWLFDSSIFTLLEKWFHEFVLENIWENKKEYYIPTFIDDLIKWKVLSCDVLESQDMRCWVTNPQDKPIVESVFSDLIRTGVYPQKLR